MARTVSKGALFSVVVEIDEDRLKALKKTPEIISGAMDQAAQYWHTKILPEHFKKGSKERYDYAERTKAYKKKRGGRPDLISSGGLRRDLLNKATFVQVGKSVNLKMYARVLNFVPNGANTLDRYVKLKSSRTGGGYPNIKREVKEILEEERVALAEIVTRAIETGMSASGFAGVFPRPQ